jgi:hypothetical protein
MRERPHGLLVPVPWDLYSAHGQRNTSHTDIDVLHFRKVEGSIPNEIIRYVFNLANPSGLTVASIRNEY